jgi:tetratricopeptide (TPR) repeat protein
VDQAVNTYEKLIADDPQYAPATRQLALLYGQLSTDRAKAYDLVTKARQNYPDDPEIAKTLGILNYRRGYYPQSVELLKEAALNLSPALADDARRALADCSEPPPG